MFSQHIPLFDLIFRDYIGFDEIMGENNTAEASMEQFLRAQEVLTQVKEGYERVLDPLGLDYFKPSDTIGLLEKLEVKTKKAREQLGELAAIETILGGAKMGNLEKIDISALDDAEKYKKKLKDVKTALKHIRKVIENLEKAKEKVEKELKKVKKSWNKLKKKGKKIFGIGRRRKRDTSGDIRQIEADLDTIISFLDRLKGKVAYSILPSHTFL